MNRLLVYLNRLSDRVAVVLEAKAEQIREEAAEHGMARYAEGYRDGYEAAMVEAGQRVRTTQPVLCGYLGVCRQPEGHEGHHKE